MRFMPALCRVVAAAWLCAAVASASAQGAGQAVDQAIALKGHKVCLKRSPDSVVQQLCIDFQMNVRVWAQMGEPTVHGSLVDWSIASVDLRAPDGRVMRARAMGREVEASLDRLALALTLDVPVFTRTRQETEVLLRVDGGSSVRQGRKPMTFPGSPDWGQLLHVARPTLDVAPDAPLGRWTCRTGLTGSHWLSGDAAKAVLRERGFRFMGADRFFVCENLVDLFGTEAIGAAIQKTCAAATPPNWCGKKPPDREAPADTQPEAKGSGSAMDRMLDARTPPAGGTARKAGSALDRLLEEESRADGELGRLTTPVQITRLDHFSRAIVPPGSRLTRGDIPPSSPGAPVLKPRYGSRHTVRDADGSSYSRLVLLEQDVIAFSAQCNDKRPVRAAYVQVKGSPTHLKLPLPANATCGYGILLQGPDAFAAVQAGQPSSQRACLLLAYEDREGRVSEPFDVGCAVHHRHHGSGPGAPPHRLEIHLRSAPLPGNFEINLWGPGTSPDNSHHTVSVHNGTQHTLWFKQRRTYKGTPIPDGQVLWTAGDTNYIRLDGAPDGNYHVRYVRGSAPEDFDVYAIVVKLDGKRALVDEGRGRLHTQRSGGKPKWLSFRKQGNTLTRIQSPCKMHGLPGQC